VGEGATAVPRVNLTVKRRNGELLALPSVLISSHDGLATSSHQAWGGFTSTGSLRDVDAICGGFGGGAVKVILSFPLRNGSSSASERDALRASTSAEGLWGG